MAHNIELANILKQEKAGDFSEGQRDRDGPNLGREESEGRALLNFRSSFSSQLLPGDRVDEELNEDDILKKIEICQQRITDICENTEWPRIEDAQKASHFAKLGAMSKAYHYAKLYRCCAKQFRTDAADQYWQEALEHLQRYCDYPTLQDHDYQAWLDLSSLHAQSFQMHIFGKRQLSHEDQVRHIQEWLKAINRALHIQKCHEAMFRKAQALQLLLELNANPPESPTDALLDYLNHHPNRSSDEYLDHAQLYGGEIARLGNLEKAESWFLELLDTRPHFITYLYLGKVVDQLDRKEVALSYFKKAFALAPNNPETELWLASQEAKQSIFEMRATKQVSPEKIEQLVKIFNRFYATSLDTNNQQQTSTFLSLRVLAEHLYSTIFVDAANLLVQLKQFDLALKFYQCILDHCANSEDSTLKSRLYEAIGTLHFFLEDCDLAETNLCRALELDDESWIVYQNLPGVYGKRQEASKLSDLWGKLKSLVQNSPPGLEMMISTILFNFGTAYVMCGKDFVGKAIEFYELSLKQHDQNRDTRTHLARLFAITDELERAEKLLIPYINDNSAPIGEPIERVFQDYFCLAAILALQGKVLEAEKWAIKASKTKQKRDAAHNLQQYLRALKSSDLNRETLREQILEAIRKMSFDVRIGKFINPKSIHIQRGTLIGYHGTTDIYADSLQKGIKSIERKKSQFKGKGFYIAIDRRAAQYFAKKTAEDRGGKPIIFSVHATQELIGQEVQINFNEVLWNGQKVKNLTSFQYDFLRTPIHGFERFSQEYVLETSLHKLTLGSPAEPVEWTNEEYQNFQKGAVAATLCSSSGQINMRNSKKVQEAHWY